MKKIYLVRHGLTQGNESGAYQVPTTPLSENGIKQATSAAKQLKDVRIEKIISSDMKRASQTAEIIGTELGLPVEHLQLFREITRPGVVRGKTREDPEVKRIMEEVFNHFFDNSWKHSDEENFHDLKTRALKGLSYIESLPEDNVLIVTHGYILRMIISVMALGDKLSEQTFQHFDAFFITKNTGITIVEEDNGKYFLLTWNDHTHLKGVPGKDDRAPSLR